MDPAVEAAANNTLVDTSDAAEPALNGELGIIVDAPGNKLPAGSSYRASVIYVPKNAGK